MMEDQHQTQIPRVHTTDFIFLASMQFVSFNMHHILNKMFLCINSKSQSLDGLENKLNIPNTKSV